VVYLGLRFAVMVAGFGVVVRRYSERPTTVKVLKLVEVREHQPEGAISYAEHTAQPTWELCSSYGGSFTQSPSGVCRLHATIYTYIPGLLSRTLGGPLGGHQVK